MSYFRLVTLLCLLIMGCRLSSSILLCLGGLLITALLSSFGCLTFGSYLSGICCIFSLRICHLSSSLPVELMRMNLCLLHHPLGMYLLIRNSGLLCSAPILFVKVFEQMSVLSIYYLSLVAIQVSIPLLMLLPAK